MKNTAKGMMLAATLCVAWLVAGCTDENGNTYSPYGSIASGGSGALGVSVSNGGTGGSVGVTTTNSTINTVTVGYQTGSVTINGSYNPSTGATSISVSTTNLSGFFNGIVNFVSSLSE